MPIIAVFWNYYSFICIFVVVDNFCETSFRFIQGYHLRINFSLIIYLNPDKTMLFWNRQIYVLIKILIFIPVLFQT